jgi:hypothetical protein
MNTRICLALALMLGSGLCWAQGEKAMSGNKDAEDKIVQTEKQLWEAWKKSDAKPFQEHLADRAVGVSSRGVMEGTQAVVQDITGGKCDVSSYSLEDTKVTWLDSNTALLTYKGNQDATCEGKKIPATVYASSIYVKRGNNWKAMFHQETPTMEAMQSKE